MTTDVKQPLPSGKAEPEVEKLGEVVVRFAGDSGDGMQLTGTQFTATSALVGNDLATFPDFPAEIRAPAGTLPGVSAFQVQLRRLRHPHAGRRARRAGGHEPGGAQAVNLGDLKPDGILIVNTDAFNANNLKKAGYDDEPARGRHARRLPAVQADITTLTRRALEDSRPRLQEPRPLQELLRPGHDLLALQPAARHHRRVAREEVQQPARSSPRPTSRR